MSRARKVAIGVSVAVVLVLAGWVGTLRSAGDPEGPAGTLAFERLLATYGMDVAAADQPREDATFVLLDDLRTPEEAAEVAGWVRDGGRLLLADPDSATAAELGIHPGRLVGGALSATVRLGVDCVAPELVGVDAVNVRGTNWRLDAGQRPGVRCLARGGGDGWLLVADVGEGRVVVTGGRSAFTNELLATGGNAAFALRAVGWPRTSAVTLGAPSPASPAPEGPLDALSAGVVAALIGGAVALVAFALVRGRRLGMPRPEEADSPRPVSELIDATGALYRGAGARPHVAGLLCDDAARRLRRALGLPPDASVDEVVTLGAGLAGSDPRRLTRLLDGPAPRDEDELLALARELEATVRDVESGGVGGPHGGTDTPDSRPHRTPDSAPAGTRDTQRSTT